MKHTNYPNLLKMIISRNKGFWRIEAIGRLSKKINQGQIQLEYLKNLITRHEKQNQIHSFLQINSLKTFSRKINSIQNGRSKSSQTFFVTQIPPFNRRMHNYNEKLFMSEFEENMYSPIELHPFEIKYTRQRDENQKYFNVQELKKEIEKNYNYIRNEQIKNRPFSSYYKNKMNKKDLFGYERKKSNSNNISINHYYSNNLNMSKKRKKGYRINFNDINYNNENTNKTINQNWRNPQQKKRLISAYLNNRARGNLFGEENELFENIKKNKTLLSNLSTKNKTVNNFSSMTDNSNFFFKKDEFPDKFFSLSDINKSEKSKRLFSSINSEHKRNMKNFFNDLKNRNRKNKSARINKNFILNHGNIPIKKNFFNSNNNNFKDQNYNSILSKNEDNDTFIDKKSKVIKIK